MSKKNKYVLFEITPEIEHFDELCEKNKTIDKITAAILFFIHYPYFAFYFLH